MFISGYLAYVTFRMERFNFFNVVLYLGKKCRTLLLPFLTWGILIPFFLLRNIDKSFGMYVYDYIYHWTALSMPRFRLTSTARAMRQKATAVTALR